MNRCFIYSWKIDKEVQETTVIRAYGLNDKNQTVCLRIQDFTPYLYIELDSRIQWTTKNFAAFRLFLIDRLGEGLTPINVEMVRRYKLYGANVDPVTLDRIPFAFAFCNFSNRDAPLSASKKFIGSFSELVNALEDKDEDFLHKKFAGSKAIRDSILVPESNEKK